MASSHAPVRSMVKLRGISAMASVIDDHAERDERPRGSTVPAQIQGQNLLPLIGAKKMDAPRELYAESFLARLHFNWSELRAVETERYHFIDAPKPELYDLLKH